jgi:hypothetical protein
LAGVVGWRGGNWDMIGMCCCLFVNQERRGW